MLSVAKELHLELESCITYVIGSWWSIIVIKSILCAASPKMETLYSFLIFSKY